jgi:hypothetical protein
MVYFSPHPLRSNREIPAKSKSTEVIDFMVGFEV